MSKLLFDEATAQQTRGVLLVLTGPTGAGKDTVFHQIEQKNPSVVKIITTTSRQMRTHESEGNPYHFISRDEFEKKIAEGEFFEWVEFRGDLKGTSRKTLETAIDSGKDIIWRIDAKGVKNIKQKLKEMVPRSVFVFLTSPLSVLEQRVKHDEGEEHLKRWNESLVKWEMDQFDDCDYLVVNEENKLEKTVESVLSIMQAKRLEIQRSAV